MRLLNTTTLKLCFFLQNVPPYVILSHTWGDDEVTFDDIEKPHAKEMAGYDKIIRCCQQAVLDGFEWAWIDTCSIDKRSSSELSEAINSMYQWYWQAEICYAYLADVEGVNPNDNTSHPMAGARWFKRGWTLQELLAPRVVEFYNQDWEFIGTKCMLADFIQQETGIEQKYLLDRRLVKEASVATKFSWVSWRNTTRVEDMAYCLLGLVDINMAMLYGEGPKAFYRLQLELLKKTNEHTIFAWRASTKDSHRMTGLLCPWPSFFRKSAQILARREGNDAEHEMTNRGLRMRLPCLYVGNDEYLAILNCQDGDPNDDSRPGIWLKRTGNEQFQRMEFSQMPSVHVDSVEMAQMENMYIVADGPNGEPKEPTEYQIQVRGTDTGNSHYRLVCMERASIVKSLPGPMIETGCEPLELGHVEFGGLLFHGSMQDLLVIVGQADLGIWVRVVGKFAMSRSEMQASLLYTARNIERMDDKQELVGDHLSMSLKGNTTVSVSAKRRRRASGLWWDLKVEVNDT
jgi:hypothetical protein